MPEGEPPAELFPSPEREVPLHTVAYLFLQTRQTMSEALNRQRLSDAQHDALTAIDELDLLADALVRRYPELGAEIIQATEAHSNPEHSEELGYWEWYPTAGAEADSAQQ